MDRMHCALVSRALEEPLAGTAAHTAGWVVVEHPGPWTPRAPTVAELGPVAQHLDVDAVRVQLIRPVRHPHVPHGSPGASHVPNASHVPSVRHRGHTVLLAHSDVEPGMRWMERLRVDDLAELRDLDPTVVTHPQAPGLGEPVTHDVWLVCAHARRDACCAVHGRPAAMALDLAGVEVWETTHTGGHRFAATAVVLPDGLSLGRLDTVDVVAVARELADDRLPVDLLRGRCAAERSAQVAEVALRRHLGLTGRDAVLPSAVHHLDADHLDADPVRVTLRADGAAWWVPVSVRSAALARPVSDGAEPTTPDHYEVGPIVPAGR